MVEKKKIDFSKLDLELIDIYRNKKNLNKMIENKIREVIESELTD